MAELNITKKRANALSAAGWLISEDVVVWARKKWDGEKLIERYPEPVFTNLASESPQEAPVAVANAGFVLANDSI